ncbi:O-antigen ligase family protein [Novosphingobium sp. MW5]|nr:O-antigen ligase family protein [Novosphingobium sp. MW5]
MAQTGRDDDHTIDALHAPVAKGNARAGRLAGWCWSLLLTTVLVIGGANVAYPLMRVLCGVLGGLAMAVALTSRHSQWARFGWTDGIVAGIVLVFVIQIIPMPPALWTLLPGREAIAVIDREVFGQLQWRPITIDSEATFQSAAFIIPFIGIYLAWRSGNGPRREGMVRGIWIALAIAVALGLLQLAGLGMLHPYPVESDNEFGNGFFTNHNHQATFVLMAAALAVALGRGLPRAIGEGRVLGLAVGVSLAVLASGSRAGVVLMAAVLALLAAGWAASRLRPASRGGRFGRGYLLGGALLGVTLVGAVSAMIGADRFAMGRGALGEDQRFEMTPIAWKAIGQFWPTGSGFGTFQVPYRQVEPVEAVRMLNVMHAHNDLLEALVEGGVLALLLIAAALIRIGCLARKGWRQKGETRVRSALVAVALMVPLAHSLVDYPLRTMAISVLFALALAALDTNTSNASAMNA